MPTCRRSSSRDCALKVSGLGVALESGRDMELEQERQRRYEIDCNLVVDALVFWRAGFVSFVASGDLVWCIGKNVESYNNDILYTP
jgi:hypothetical protein